MRSGPTRPPVAPIHRGPQAITAAAPYGAPAFAHAPNAALLIDFDNVTMGIRSDLGHELRNLLSSDIIKGKVAVQRAYADWRRYPQYIVPLTEASIDLIYAPAYGSSKKNATDIRLAIDALELVFTRSEIGTFILLSGDSDFSSLVIKLKEYGKYVIGVGIRESSSDLLVMNCDEYYSYNALAGLVKTGEDEVVARDPWELVVEAVTRMKRNGDVMRSDRLKQVMQEIDASFDEKNLGMAKFSRFCQEAAHRGLIRVTRLENGQLEVDVAGAPAGNGRAVETEAAPPARPHAPEEKERRGRRGRGRDRQGRAPAARPAAAAEAPGAEAAAAPAAQPAPAAPPAPAGERLTRDEALQLVQRAVKELAATPEHAVPADAVRSKARELLGRDSETLNERFFHRILRDAHDAALVDLRKHGDAYEVAPLAAPAAASAAASVAAAAGGDSQAARSAANAASLRRGIRHRGTRPASGGELPPELLSIGVVDTIPAAAAPESPAAAVASAAPAAEAPAAADGRKKRAPRTRTPRAARKTPAATDGAGAPAAAEAPPPAEEAPARARRPRARKKASSAGKHT